MARTLRSRRRHIVPISGIEQLTLKNMKDVDVGEPIGYEMLVYDSLIDKWTFTTPLIGDVSCTVLIDEEGQLVLAG